MTAKTRQKTLHTLARRYPGRVLKNIRFEYGGFDVHFDLPRKRRLAISVSAYAKENGTIEVYETAKGSNAHHYWLIDGNSYTVEGTDPLPLLTSYLKTTIGRIEHSYEGSFAEVALAVFRVEKESA
jgi:hypothetical protein